MKKTILILLIVIPLAIFVYFILQTLSYPVLYDREIPLQDLTHWEIIKIDDYTLRRDMYDLRFQGNVIIGYTDIGATVLVFIGDGEITVQPDFFEHTGKLLVRRDDIEMSDEEPVFNERYNFTSAFIRMNPGDPYIPGGNQIENDELLQQGIAIYQTKHPRYLSDNDKVRIPKQEVRVIDMKIETRDLLIIDAEERLSLYYVEGE